MLGRKQRITNEQWLEAAANIKNLISAAEVKKFEKAAVTDIKSKTKGKKAAYAWSGGKDSIVLAALCEKAGISDCMMGVCNLEYPAFMAWVKESKPINLEIVNTGQDMAWLSKHPDMLFPRAEKAGRWYSIVQHKAQEKYFYKHGFDVLALGRRKADGNYVGKPSSLPAGAGRAANVGDNIYTAKGITRYSPIADWPHEMVLAYISYNDLPMPPIYGWPNGYKCGTHPWPARQYTGSIENGWQEISSIDPTLIEEATRAGIESAIKFLEGRT